MQQNNSVSFFAPGFDDTIEQQKIERQRKIAEAMMQQSQGQSKGQMVGQIYVPPHWSEGIAKIAQAYFGAKKGADADEKQSALAQAMQTRNQQEAKDFFSTLRGTPAQSFGNGIPNDDDGNVMPVPADRAAVPGDQNRAIEMAFNAKSPMVQAYGGQLATGQLQQQQMMDKLAAALKMAGGGGTPGQATGPGAVSGGGTPATIGGANPLAMALTLTGDPALAKAGGLVADANKPLAAREGDVLVPDGNGGMRSVWSAPKSEPGIQLNRGPGGQVSSASEIPGYGPAAASIKGAGTKATEDIKAGLEMVTVDVDPDPARGIKGGPTLMRRSDAARIAGGGQPSSAPIARPQPAAQPLPRAVQPQPGMNGKFVGSPEEAMASIMDIKDPQERANAMSAFEKQAAQDPNFKIAKTMGGIPLRSDASKAYATERAKDFANQAKTLAESASKSAGMLSTIGSLESLYSDPNVVKGGGAEFTSGLKNVAAAFGVDIKGLGAEQAIASITAKMAIDLRSTAEGGGMPGALSDRDLSFLVSMTPGLSKTPEGRALIMETQKRVSKRQIEVAKLATQYEQQHGTLDVGFQKQMQALADSSPLFAGLIMPTAAAAPQRAASHPPAITNILNKYNGGAAGSW